MFDLAIVGSGFAGSLLAMIAQRLGRSVILIEREKHPRFAIGESSTPLANLLLEELATRYDLGAVLPFTKWGTWQRDRPDVACGLKRGFSFFHHEFDKPWANDPDRSDQLLVAASPNDEIADTHWYRPDFDAALVEAAVASGVTYVDEVHLERMTFTGATAHLDGMRRGQDVQYAARFLVDATGPRGFTHRALGLPEAELPNLPPTEALYSHFEGVRTFAEATAGSFDDAPYPVDEAAVHHVFDGGWVWILRFNNGITSAGVAAKASSLNRGEADWAALLRRLPSVREQFRDAHAVTPFRHRPRLAFRSGRWTGEQWTQLPSASAFIDPLLSTGFTLTLLGLCRLARTIEEDWGHPRFAESLRNIADANQRDFLAAEHVVSALYAQMHDFPVFRALSLIYFAAASFSECARRLGFAHLDEGFLLHRNARFKSIEQLCARARAGLKHTERQQFIDEIIRTIESINIVGLGSTERLHWYPADLQCLFANAGKLGATDHEITAMIDKMMVHA